MHHQSMDTHVELSVDGMTCPSCVRSVAKKLAGVVSVNSAVVDLAAGRATIGYDDSRANVEDLIAAVEQIGFHARR
jgi:copper chaperone CopZ